MSGPTRFETNAHNSDVFTEMLSYADLQSMDTLRSVSTGLTSLVTPYFHNHLYQFKTHIYAVKSRDSLKARRNFGRPPSPQRARCKIVSHQSNVRRVQLAYVCLFSHRATIT